MTCSCGRAAHKLAQLEKVSLIKLCAGRKTGTDRGGGGARARPRRQRKLMYRGNNNPLPDNTTKDAADRDAIRKVLDRTSRSQIWITHAQAQSDVGILD